MNDSAAPSFEQIHTLLQNYGALQSAAELHGFLAGQLAAGRRLSRGEWLRAANEAADLSQNPDEVAGDSLYEMYRSTLAALQSGELSFHPLLPDDDSALVERVDGLGQWCQGFLAGFGMAGSKLPIDEDLAEALRDLSAIAQVGASDDDGEGENSESDLFSICEYVRLTAVEIFTQYNVQQDLPHGAAAQDDVRHGATASPLAAAVAQALPGAEEARPGSPADLFRRNKKLH
jgi:yecA family protein